MIWIRRDRPAGDRFLAWRIGLFSLAAGVWVAGVAVGRRELTGAAIVVLIIALLLGLLAKRSTPRRDS